MGKTGECDTRYAAVEEHDGMNHGHHWKIVPHQMWWTSRRGQDGVRRKRDTVAVAGTPLKSSDCVTPGENY